MRIRPTLLLAVASAAALVSGCSRRPINASDTQRTNTDANTLRDVSPGESSSDLQQEGPALDAGNSEPVADAGQDDGGPDAASCYPLFHACTGSEQCCAPNLCLDITGTPACQIEGPRPTPYTSWTSCGWSGGPCLCDGISACQAVAGGSFSSLGSQQARVCAIEGEVCEYVVFVETEGGGTARRCRVPLGEGSCLTGFGNADDSHCVDLFTCNLLMGTCPPDIMPGASVISCR